MLKLLDFFFILFHTCLIFFNLFGWISRKTRVWNLVTLLLTGSSWFVLGIFYGIGYCPFTDWHFRVLERMGETNLPVSYIKYLVERFLPVTVDPGLVDIFTVTLFFAALIVSITLNCLDRFYVRKKKRAGYYK
jgi:membrane-associated phospholipid phosphatase